MALVEITGFVRNADRIPIAAAQDPRLWFRPLKPESVSGLMTANEAQAATLNQATGAFTVKLESDTDLMYVPVLDWIKPGMEAEAPKNRMREHEEWPPFNPGPGGDISALMPFAHLRGVIAGFGAKFSWPTPVIYLNLSEPSGKLGIYGPADALVAGGA